MSSHQRNWLLLFFGLVLLVCQTKSLSAASDGFTITMVPAASTLSAGEPIVLNYEFRNTTSGRCTFLLLDTHPEWIHWELRSKSGAVVMRDQRCITPPGGYEYADGLRAGEVRNSKVAVGPGNWTPRVGDYLLHVVVHLAYVLRSQDNHFSNGIVNKEYDFPLTVTSRNDEQLIKVAKALKSRIFTRKGEEQEIAITSLFALPEEIALPYWKQIISHVSPQEVDSESVVSTLQYLGTPTAVRLLGYMCRDGNDRMGEASHALQVLYHEGPKELQPQIKTVYYEQCGVDISKEGYVRVRNVD